CQGFCERRAALLRADDELRDGPPPEGSSMKKCAGLIAVLLLTTVVRPGATAAQGFATVDTPTIEGAHDLILIPANWNGSLFIYAHVYSADEPLLQPF